MRTNVRFCKKLITKLLLLLSYLPVLILGGFYGSYKTYQYNEYFIAPAETNEKINEIDLITNNNSDVLLKWLQFDVLSDISKYGYNIHSSGGFFEYSSFIFKNIEFDQIKLLLSSPAYAIDKQYLFNYQNFLNTNKYIIANCSELSGEVSNQKRDECVEYNEAINIRNNEISSFRDYYDI